MPEEDEVGLIEYDTTGHVTNYRYSANDLSVICHRGFLQDQDQRALDEIESVESAYRTKVGFIEYRKPGVNEAWHPLRWDEQQEDGSWEAFKPRFVGAMA